MRSNISSVLRLGAAIWLGAGLWLVPCGATADVDPAILRQRLETGVDSAALRQRLAAGVLRWGGDAEGGAPYQLRDPKDPDRVIGFEVEIADALAEQLARMIGRPVRAEFVQYQWESLELGLLQARDFDLILSGFEITPSRRREMLFSRPYYVYTQQLVCRRDDDRIRSLDDCRDKVVGTLGGSDAERILQEHDIPHESFEGQVEPYLDLELGRLDAVLLDTPIALFYASTNPALRYVGESFAPGRYGIALRPEDRALAAALDEALGELMRSGRLQRIYRRWHIWDAAQAALAEGALAAEELAGLGFAADGQPLDPDAAAPADAVDLRIIAASATEWTFSAYAPLLLGAAGMTVVLSVASMALAVVLGLVVCVTRMYGPWPMRWAALGYIEFFRGIPLLLLLFFLYFGLSHFGLAMSAVVTAIVGFGLNYAAYEAEIYRSAIESVPGGQWEAGRALGMSDRQVFRLVIFPQALRTALGPITNDFVALFKDTSLVSVIAVRELTKEYLILSRSSLKFVELGLLTAVLYLAMSVPLGYLSRRLEARWHRG
jgi:polar amino acid transport system substrate-binding protein